MQASDEPLRRNRIPIMLSDGEVTEVDDWRFSNRVGTRSEAIRRLVKLGLNANQGRDNGSE